MPTQREWITQLIQQHYRVQAEYLWRKHPDYAVFRHAHNRKWFAITMTVLGSQIALPDVANIQIMNVKLPTEWVAELRGQHGFAPAYHMNKTHWLSVRLDNTLPEQQLMDLLQQSFVQTE